VRPGSCLRTGSGPPSFLVAGGRSPGLNLQIVSSRLALVRALSKDFTRNSQPVSRTRVTRIERRVEDRLDDLLRCDAHIQSCPHVQSELWFGTADRRQHSDVDQLALGQRQGLTPVDIGEARFDHVGSEVRTDLIESCQRACRGLRTENPVHQLPAAVVPFSLSR